MTEQLTKDQKRSRLPHEYLGPPFPQIYLLKCAVYAAWKSNLIGGPQASHDRFEWFKRLEPGHLIMETTTAWDNRRDEERFGYLVSNAMEPCHSDEEWLELLKAGDYDEEQDKRPMERIYRIKLLTDGRDFRWENADFIRVPTDLRDFP